MRIITTNKELQILCAEISNCNYVTVDMEFIRERTYWPESCLIQVASKDIEAIIDPLAIDPEGEKQLDLNPFLDLMMNQDITKVFHSGRQDIEIIYHKSGKLPDPIFDTQIAAMVCGFGEAISYEKIVSSMLGATIDKSSRFTNWKQRPLSEKQLLYAMSDVTYLRDIYHKLLDILQQNGRENWLKEEISILQQENTYLIADENAWKKVKYSPRNKKELAVLIELAAWRENEAKKLDRPRNHILREESLKELAIQRPKDQNGLKNVRNMTKSALGKRSQCLLNAIAKGMAADHHSLPEVKSKKRISEKASNIAEILKLALKIIGEQQGVAPKVIATASDLNIIASEENPDVMAMHGWRYEIFGKQAIALKNSHSCIVIKGKKIAIEDYKA